MTIARRPRWPSVSVRTFRGFGARRGFAAATQVGDLRAAARAVEAGCDVVIARGAEGGGHGEPTVGTLPLLAAILDHLSVPVLAAGGVSSGRATAAVLAAGASGA